jgi:hypothetical protein
MPESTVPSLDLMSESAVPPFDLMPKSTGNRKPNSNNVSPPLDDEVSYPERQNPHVELTIEYRLLNLDASQQFFRTWSLLPPIFC